MNYCAAHHRHYPGTRCPDCAKPPINTKPLVVSK